MDESLNVLGEPLKDCGRDPLTGFFRNGCCDTSEEDFGMHTVCARMTSTFLEFSKSQGNDLSTPRPEFGFDGLQPGDRWCLCAARWQEAYEAGMAPEVFLESTHQATLKVVELDNLQKHAVDVNYSPLYLFHFLFFVVIHTSRSKSCMML